MAFNLFGNPTVHPLPLPPIEPRVLRLIERAICKAWEMLRTNPPSTFNIDTATEDEVTLALHNTLVNRVLYTRAVPGFTPDLFRVAREPKVWSHDEGSLDKMPDLFVYLISNRVVAFPDQDGIFAECKPIDADHAVGGHYCDRGLCRFVDGEYAWAMQEGMMIGYTIKGYDLPQALAAPLKAGNRPTRMPLISGPVAVPRTAATATAQRPHVTEHSRPFNYANGSSPPNITLYHLWLGRE